MAATRVTLHLDPVNSMDNLLAVVDALMRSGQDTFSSLGEMTGCIQRDYVFTDRTEPLTLALRLGLLDKCEEGYRLSHVACAISFLRPPSRADVLHFLLDTAWKKEASEPALGMSWMYRTFCAMLWEYGGVQIDSTTIKRFVADLEGLAQDTFRDAPLLAFSAKSVRGMRNWLQSLDPPVLDGNTFRRRDLCSRELLALSIGQVAWEGQTALDADLLLTPERREAICRLCLLEPSALDRRLDQVMPLYPHLMAPGTRTGMYGRFIQLHALPTVETLFTA